MIQACFDNIMKKGEAYGFKGKKEETYKADKKKYV